MDIKEIQNLIKFVAKSGASEVKLEMGDIKITIKTGGDNRGEGITYVQQIPASSPATVQAQVIPTAETPIAATPSKDDNSKYITIKSPIIGTFYRKTYPDKTVFVEVD
jgi:acetyl-CoA carboxylase biotin carboxyl carrier protein